MITEKICWKSLSLTGYTAGKFHLSWAGKKSEGSYEAQRNGLMEAAAAKVEQ
jgi:hypothetical protein